MAHFYGEYQDAYRVPMERDDKRYLRPENYENAAKSGYTCHGRRPRGSRPGDIVSEETASAMDGFRKEGATMRSFLSDY